MSTTVVGISIAAVGVISWVMTLIWSRYDAPTTPTSWASTKNLTEFARF